MDLPPAGAVEVVDVWRHYGPADGGFDALRGITLSVPAGEFLAVMGPSGSGKSTLMHLIGALDRPTRGEVRLDGESLARLSRKSLARLRARKVGFVFQAFNLLSTLTVRRNVLLPALFAGRRVSEDRARADDLLEALGVGGLLDRYPSQLSGGEQQRVAIARAMINEPAVLLADEPTGNLDSASGQRVLELLRECHLRGTTVILVTHDPDVASIAQRVVLVRDGVVVEDSEIRPEPLVDRVVPSSPPGLTR